MLRFPARFPRKRSDARQKPDLGAADSPAPKGMKLGPGPNASRVTIGGTKYPACLVSRGEPSFAFHILGRADN
jgi:hypothetical protein